jgi:hypothetical protein
MAQDTDQDTSTPFRLTKLYTMIVRTHEMRNIDIGKVMRIALLAAADGKFALRDHRGLKSDLTPGYRDALERFAAEAEQQSGHRWWTKSPWTDLLRDVFVDEDEFFAALDNGASGTLPTVETPDGPNRSQGLTPFAKANQPAIAPRPEPKEAIRKAKADTQHQRLVNLMKELRLPKQTILPREVRKAVVGPYKQQHGEEPSHSAITRAYQQYLEDPA